MDDAVTSDRQDMAGGNNHRTGPHHHIRQAARPVTNSLRSDQGIAARGEHLSIVRACSLRGIAPHNHASGEAKHG